MDDTEENKVPIYIYIYICDNLLNCQQPPQHIHLKEKKQVLIIKK